MRDNLELFRSGVVDLNRCHTPDLDLPEPSDTMQDLVGESFMATFGFKRPLSPRPIRVVAAVSHYIFNPFRVHNAVMPFWAAPSEEVQARQAELNPSIDSDIR